MLALTLSTKLAYSSSKEGVGVLAYTEELLSQWAGLPFCTASQPAVPTLKAYVVWERLV